LTIPLGDDTQDLLDTVELGCGVTQGLQLSDDARDTKREVLDVLPRLERQLIEILAQPLAPGLADAIHADAHGLDRVPGGLGVVLGRQHLHHLRWHRSQDGAQRLTFLPFRGVVGVDGVPEASALELHAHQDGPLGVVCFCERRP
jgi:hypothetical protein